MLKLLKNEIEIGQKVQIRNTWRSSVANILGKDEELIPFCFKITDIITINKEQYYKSESISDDKNDEVYSVVMSESVIRYLSADEVADCNVGLYFNDYLPLENKKLLILDSKNPLIVHPVIFRFDVSTSKALDSQIPVLDFKLDNLLTNEIYSLKSQGKNSWKFLKGDADYMTDVEKMFQDTFIHKEYVLNVCNKFAVYLEGQGLTEEANTLRQRAIVHDNSKILNKDEFRALTGIINDKSCLRDASAKLTPFKEDALILHWKHNAHHPEHFENILDMTRMDKLEMCCDWCARSLQNGTDLVPFIKERQENRFHFPEMMYEEILHYCKILSELCN